MRLYTFLLHLYPTAFRLEYGEEMRRIFAARRQDVRGPFLVAKLWVEAFWDILRNSVLVHYDILRQDLRYAYRLLRRIPAFALTIVVVTAFGIGANIAIFSIVDHSLIRPLPYPEADRILQVWQTSPAYARLEASPANMQDWITRSRSFTGIAAYWPYEMNLSGSENAARFTGAKVTSTFFPVLGVRPDYGRWFRPEDERFGAPGTALISNQLWKTAFDGNPDVVGKEILLDAEAYKVIGILPDGFYFPSPDTMFWIPFRIQAADFQNRTDESLYVIARLKNGIRLKDAQAEMESIAKDLERQYPETNTGSGVRIERIRDSISKRARIQLNILCAASFCILLIACINLASLFIVRAMGRTGELSLRDALGAGRERLIRQLLTEAMMLIAAGGLLGVIVAAAIMPLLEIFVPQFLPIGSASIWNFRTLVFAATLTSLTGLIFGTVPAMRIFRRTHAGDIQTLRPVMRYKSGRYQSILVTIQVAASVILLISSGLLIRALWRIQAVDPGFSSESVFTAQTALPFPKYDSVKKRESFYSEVLSQIRVVPEVSSASYISFLPMVMSGGIWQVGIGQEAVSNPVTTPRASLRYVTSDFFKTLKIPMHAGRDILKSDTWDSPHVAVVSQSFVDRFLQGKAPIGQTFNIAFEDRKVAGVVGDIRVRGLEISSEPQVYLPHMQVPDAFMTDYAPRYLVVKSSRNADAVLEAVRSAVQIADPDVPVSDARTLSNILNSNTAARRAQIHVFGVFGGLSLLLAGIGIYGLVAFGISRREQEIGVRMALGATGKIILRMILRQSFKILIFGLVAGIALGYIAGWLMQPLLAGTSPGDLAVFFAACALAALAALFGSLAPALRAVKIDPVQAMRVE